MVIDYKTGSASPYRELEGPDRQGQAAAAGQSTRWQPAGLCPPPPWSRPPTGSPPTGVSSPCTRKITCTSTTRRPPSGSGMASPPSSKASGQGVFPANPGRSGLGRPAGQLPLLRLRLSLPIEARGHVAAQEGRPSAGLVREACRGRRRFRRRRGVAWPRRHPRKFRRQRPVQAERRGRAAHHRARAGRDPVRGGQRRDRQDPQPGRSDGEPGGGRRDHPGPRRCHHLHGGRRLGAPVPHPRRAGEGGGDDAGRSTAGSAARSGIADLDQATIRTLHSFAGMLLHERPLEAGLPPGFEITDGIAAGLRFDEAWEAWLDEVLENRLQF